jgi:hypothetical protein
MTLKRKNNPEEPIQPQGDGQVSNTPEPEQTSVFNYEQQQESLKQDFSHIDSNEPVVVLNTESIPAVIDNTDTVNALADLAEAVSKKMKQDQADNTMTSVPAEAYTRGGNVQVTPSSDKKAFLGPITPRQREDMIERFRARTATDDDMRRLDESMILDLSFIKTAGYDIQDSFHPIPKDPSIRFRWVNKVNFVQGNMMRLMADGFEAASIDDVDTVKTPIHPKMIDGTQITQYDVVLMKISVLKLMAIYKRNIEVAAFKLDGITSGKMAEAAASQSFNDLIGFEPGGRGTLNKYRQASGKEPVTFSRT